MTPAAPYDEEPKPLQEMLQTLQMPKQIHLNKTMLSAVDIAEGEKVLCLNGIRISDAHPVVREFLIAVTDTDIDA
jgi:hypothetical protein